MTWALILRWCMKHWRDLLFGGLALFFAFKAMYSRHQYIVVLGERDKVTAEYSQAKDAWTIRESELMTAIEAYKQQQADFARIVRDETAKLEAAKAESAQAVSEANATKAKAEASLAGWMGQYKNRPEPCKAALEALEVSCPAFRGNY